MVDMNDEIDNRPLERIRALFAENAADRGIDVSNMPINGDVRIHFTGHPTAGFSEFPPSDISWVVGAFMDASIRANFELGSVRSHVDPLTYVQAVFSKEIEGFPADKKQRLFIDLDIKDFKDLWAEQLSSDHSDIINNVDRLISSLRFQLECLLHNNVAIEKVETANVVVDLTKFKSLAVDKNVPTGPAQSSLPLPSDPAP